MVAATQSNGVGPYLCNTTIVNILLRQHYTLSYVIAGELIVWHDSRYDNNYSGNTIAVRMSKLNDKRCEFRSVIDRFFTLERDVIE